MKVMCLCFKTFFLQCLSLYCCFLPVYTLNNNNNNKCFRVNWFIYNLSMPSKLLTSPLPSMKIRNKNVVVRTNPAVSLLAIYRHFLSDSIIWRAIRCFKCCNVWWWRLPHRDRLYRYYRFCYVIKY